MPEVTQKTPLELMAYGLWLQEVNGIQANMTKSVKSCRFLSVAGSSNHENKRKEMAVATSFSRGSDRPHMYLRRKRIQLLLLESHVLGDVSAVGCGFRHSESSRRRNGVHPDHRVCVGAIIPAARGAYAQRAGAGGVIGNRNGPRRCAAQHVVIAAFGAVRIAATHNVIDQAGIGGNWRCAVRGARSKDRQGGCKTRSHVRG